MLSKQRLFFLSQALNTLLIIGLHCTSAVGAESKDKKSDPVRVNQTVDSTQTPSDLQQLKLYLPKILADQKDIYESGVVPTRTNIGSDAGDYLNSRVRLEGGRFDEVNNQIVPVTCNDVNNEIKLPAEIISKVQGVPTAKWVNADSTIDFSKIDFSWMNKILEFDHWSLPQVKSENIKYCNLVPNMMPDWKEWAILRLLKGKKEGQILQAVKEVRHLAKLLMTWNTLMGLTEGNILYGIEKALYESIMSKDRPENWQPISNKLRFQIKRYSYIYASVLSKAKWIPEKTLEKLYFNKYSSVGICAALDQSTCTLAVPECLQNKHSKRFIAKLSSLKSVYKESCNSWSAFENKLAEAKASYLDNISKENRADVNTVPSQPTLFLNSYNPKYEYFR